jgi:hypothetical protein
MALSATFVLLSTVPSPGQDLAGSTVASAPSTPGAKIWVGRHAEFEECLRTTPIERMEKVGEGVTDPDRAFFAAGAVARCALVKVLPPGRQSGYWESYQSEIAAYELDRLLGLGMVPVTVARRIEDHEASVQLWVRGRLLSEIGRQTPPNPAVWSRQVRRQRLFDALIANIDRTAENILVDEDWDIVLIDHSRAFAVDTMPFEEQITRIDRPLFEALKALDGATLGERVRPWLFDDKALRALLGRRDKLVGRLERLIEERGEAVVLSR